MASVVRRAGVVAARVPSRPTQIIQQKRFGSHATHSTGPEAPPTDEGFTSGGFKLALIAVVGLMAWSRIDEHLTSQGEEKHPFTRYIEYYMRSEKESARLNEQHINLADKAAQEARFYSLAQTPPKVQLRYPDLINNNSSKCVEVGTTVDTSNLTVKYH